MKQIKQCACGIAQGDCEYHRPDELKFKWVCPAEVDYEHIRHKEITIRRYDSNGNLLPGATNPETIRTCGIWHNPNVTWEDICVRRAEYESSLKKKLLDKPD